MLSTLRRHPGHSVGIKFFAFPSPSHPVTIADMSNTLQERSRTWVQARGVRLAAVLLAGGIVLSLLGCIAVVILAFAVPNGVMALMGIPALVFFAGVCGGLLALLAWLQPRQFPRGLSDAIVNWGVFLLFAGLVGVCFAHFG